MTSDASWDLLIVGGTILTMEDGAEPIVDGAIAVADGKIAAIGPTEEILEIAPTGEMLNASNCLIMPGFVNTHSHLAMTLLRGIADDLPLMTWLREHIWPAEGKFMSRGTVRLGTMLAAAEQLLAGITTTTDMYFFGDEVGKALASAGMRAAITEPLIDFATPRCAGPEEMLERQVELIEQYKDHPLISASVAAHSPYTVCAANLVKVAELAEEHHVPMQIHLAETRWEVDKLLEEKGMTPVAYLADLGVLSERTVAAHCVHVSPDDMEILAEFEVGVAHNPASNFKLASGVAPVQAMLEHGVKLALGTDGAASNNTLDLLRDAQLAAMVQKAATGDPGALPARRLLELLTVGGARVLGLDDRIGVLREGMEADLICVNMDGAHMVPMYDPFSHMAYAARASDVCHVLVKGRPVVRARKLQTLDLDSVVLQAREVAQQIQQA
jgi:5-methylthioadenosine/S-adenosylhomocysteine deaminase